MGRYQASTDEFEPGSNGVVLKNHRGIIDPAVAEQKETELLIAAQYNSLARITSEQRFDVALIAQLHFEWLQSLYPMAGHFRGVNISKGGILFCPAENLSSELSRFEREVLSLHTPCPAGTPKEIAERLSIVHTEFILIHPFREGNGRLGRWLADLMVLQSGYPAPIYRLDSDSLRKKYFDALAAGFRGDYSPLATLFEHWIERALSRSERPPNE